MWSYRDGTWVADWLESEGYDLGPASIAWLTWHLGFWLSMVTDHSFGQGTRWPFADRPFCDVVAWANVELMKSAAEVGYARFAYAVRNA